jgi:hypothetical protein
MDPARWRVLMPWYLAFLLAFPLGMAWVETRPLGGGTWCAFREATGLDCPGCGLTRAYRAMGRLDVAGAFRYNPLGPALFAATVLAWGCAIAMVGTRGRLRPPGWWPAARPWILWGALALYLGVGFARIAVEITHPPPHPGTSTPWFGGRDTR